MKALNSIFLIIMLGSILFSCDNKNSERRFGEVNELDKVTLDVDSNAEYNSKLDTQILTSKNLKLSDVLGDSGVYIWNAAGVQLYFNENKLNISFNPQCIYSYPIKIVDGNTIFIWAYNMNCTFDRGLDKEYNSIKNPKVGDRFGMITLGNNNKLKIEYFFKEWVDSVNIEAHDVYRLFPDEFDLKYVIK